MIKLLLKNTPIVFQELTLNSSGNFYSPHLYLEHICCPSWPLVRIHLQTNVKVEGSALAGKVEADHLADTGEYQYLLQPHLFPDVFLPFIYTIFRGTLSII